MDASELSRRFGAAVRRRRLAARLGQEALADKAGIHRTHVSLLERGGRLPTLLVVCKLAEAFGVTMGELLGDLDAPTPQTEPPALPRGRPRRPPPTDPGVV